MVITQNDIETILKALKYAEQIKDKEMIMNLKSYISKVNVK